jgi:protein arginine kinase activator
MLCQHCQLRIANVHFTQVINNNKVEMYLCDHCAKEKGQINFGSPLNVNDFFSGIMGLGGNTQYVVNSSLKLVCDKCKMSYEEFQKTGKLGCSNCYNVFGERLQSLFKRLHGEVEHHGRIPGKISKTIKTTKEIEKLKELLNAAIQKEEYEKAAEIRDKIRGLEVVT